MSQKLLDIPSSALWLTTGDTEYQMMYQRSVREDTEQGIPGNIKYWMKTHGNRARLKHWRSAQ